MKKKRLFIIVTIAILTISAMISNKNKEENQFADAFLRNSTSYFACTF